MFEAQGIRNNYNSIRSVEFDGSSNQPALLKIEQVRRKSFRRFEFFEIIYHHTEWATFKVSRSQKQDNRHGGTTEIFNGIINRNKKR